jgi:hypothetical protein
VQPHPTQPQNESRSLTVSCPTRFWWRAGTRWRSTLIGSPAMWSRRAVPGPASPSVPHARATSAGTRPGLVGDRQISSSDRERCWQIHACASRRLANDRDRRVRLPSGPSPGSRRATKRAPRGRMLALPLRSRCRRLLATARLPVDPHRDGKQMDGGDMHTHRRRAVDTSTGRRDLGSCATPRTGPKGPVLACAPPGTRTPNPPVKRLEGVCRTARSSRKPVLTSVNVVGTSAEVRRQPPL